MLHTKEHLASTRTHANTSLKCVYTHIKSRQLNTTNAILPLMLMPMMAVAKTLRVVPILRMTERIIVGEFSKFLRKNQQQQQPSSLLFFLFALDAFFFFFSLLKGKNPKCKKVE